MMSDPHPKCPSCGYDLVGHSGDFVRCPECGTEHPRASLFAPAPEAKPIAAIPFSVAAGILSWIVVSKLSGKPYASDAFGAWFGVTCALSAGFGFTAPRWFWLWPLLVLAGQWLVMCLGFPGMPNLWPLACCLQVSLLLPFIAAAALGAGARRSLKADRF